MRILYHHRTEGDGAEGIHIREMIRAFQANGNDVRLLSITDRGEGGEPGKSQRKPIALKNCVPAALYEFGEIAYNTVGLPMLLFGGLTIRPDFIYERYSLYNLSAGIAGKILNIPTILEVNSPLAVERSTELDEKLVFPGAGKWFEREAFRRVSGIVTVSSPLRDYIVSLGIEKGKILVLPNGVDETRFAPREKNQKWMDRYGIPSGKKVIGFSGIFRRWHGLDVLIDAFSDIFRKGAPIHLLLVGDGPMRGAIEDKIIQEGIRDACTVTGRVPYGDMPDITSLMDIAVSPRATFYASPMKIIEYMALGKPVVAPDTQNIRDIITDGTDGILFPGESPEEMKKAIAVLLEDESLYLRISRGARETVEKERNWRAIARDVTVWVGGRGWNRR